MKIIILAVVTILTILISIFFTYLNFKQPVTESYLWQIRSIDTVKYSRDLTDQMLEKKEFDATIEAQVAEIASTGASYIALGTPYDEKYVPFLKRWVEVSRKHGLKIWFRGNFSGWEGWFGFSKITSEEHKKLLSDFIINNPDLFEDGDIFTSCPECENGGEGDPRQTGNVTGFKEFLIDEYQISLSSFGKINKKVSCGYYSMNYDVASLVMDPQTTQSLGGIVVIDHYIKDPAQLSSDIDLIAQKSGGKVVLGEFGAPIPDIHGQMTEEEQSVWINTVLDSLSKSKNLIGVNYWTNVGGSTELWDSKGVAKKAVETIQKYYSIKIKS